jgi:hypothetical protein
VSNLNPDQELWAARIRPHFEPPLADMAEAVARELVPYIGEQLKALRPETTIGEIQRWLYARKDAFRSSLDWVEFFMILEDIVESEISDAFAENLEEHTFRELVVHLQRNRKSRDTR